MIKEKKINKLRDKKKSFTFLSGWRSEILKACTRAGALALAISSFKRKVFFKEFVYYGKAFMSLMGTENFIIKNEAEN
jgi:hypothetical protein